MDKYRNLDLTDEQCYTILLQGVAELQSLAGDVGITRKTLSSISEEECNKSTNISNVEEILQIIKQTTDIARFAMILLVRGAQMSALNASQKSKSFSSFSSAISYLREEYSSYHPPKHLLVEWEGNAMLIDLFVKTEGLYCSRYVAQDMFDICLETFDWLRSFADNHQ